MKLLERCIVLISFLVLLYSQKQCGLHGRFYSCDKTGLTALPKRPQDEFDVLIITNQLFTNTVLSWRNFTDYPKKLKKMKITNTSLSRIDSETFTNFEEIRELDFSSNKIEYVDAEAFANVNIINLILEKNPGIRFHQDAFKNSKIKKLSLKNCQLDRVPYRTFQPLFSYKDLSTLSLEDNRITEIDQDFLLPLRKLDSFLLNRNPIDCKCSMKWLIELSQSLKEANSDLKCASPSILADTPLANVERHLIDCQQPQIVAIEMSINLESEEEMSVDVHCKANGSEELRVHLIREKGSRQMDNTFKDNASITLHRPEPSPRLTYGGDPMLDDYGQILMNPLEPEYLKCVAQDKNGNETTNLVVNWPKILSQNLSSTYQTALSQSIQVNIENEFFLKKKFTILEMIGAVIGTFITTIALFIFLYCLRYDSVNGCYFSCCLGNGHNHKLLKNNPAMAKDSNLGLLRYQNGHLNQTAFTAINPVLIPNSYQSGVSDDANHTNSSSSGYDQNSNATLTKRVSYVTYDALSGTNNQNNNAASSNMPQMHPYIDCQTYDLPQNQIQAPTPLLPLPPLPREHPPPTPNNIYSHQQNMLDQNLQAALAVATLTRMQNNHQLTMNNGANLNNIDVNLLQQQWNYLTMLQNQNALMTPTTSSKN